MDRRIPLLSIVTLQVPAYAGILKWTKDGDWHFVGGVVDSMDEIQFPNFDSRLPNLSLGKMANTTTTLTGVIY